MSGSLRLFALGASRPMGEAVAGHLGLELAEHEVREFEDGEHKVRPTGDVRGADVYVLTSLHGDDEHHPDEKLCRLLFFCGALRDAAAARVTVVAPYLSYARKDRRTRPGDALVIRYVAQLMEAIGIGGMIAVDVHNGAAFENAFRIPAESLDTAPLLAARLRSEVGARDAVVLAPDAGASKRAERLRVVLERALGRSVGSALMEKHRTGDRIHGDLFAGEVEGRVVVIADDLIATGSTLARAVRASAERGAAAVYTVASHGLFIDGARALWDEPALEGVLVTDSVPPFRLAPGSRGRLGVVELAPTLGEAIGRWHGSPSAR